MNEASFLNRLKVAQSDFALEALRKPDTRDSFEYGYRVGVIAGLERAISILLNQLNEEKNDSNDL
jgi:hypothetical protein